MTKRVREDDDCLVQVGYVYDENLLRHASKLTNVKGRALVVQKLVESYDLLRNTVTLKPTPATEDELCTFHSSDYIQYLKNINTTYTPDDDVTLEYGIGYDCPPLDGIFDYCCSIGGATLTGAKALNKGQVDVAINWFGGWHHAQRDEADGFCYVNDVVLGILELRKCFNYIIYVDLDVHHGNGVEAGFERTPKVLTLSFHQFESGFYPGTGSTSDVGAGTGEYHSVNVPLREGIGDEHYSNVFDQNLPAINLGIQDAKNANMAKWGKKSPSSGVWSKVADSFEFDAVVVQCGADGLSGDPLGGFNLTEKAYAHCLHKILMESKPTLILGGGGYNIANTARLWAYLTSVAVGCELDSDIPEHDFFSMYGPSYELAITPSHRKDTNSKEYIDQILKEIDDNLLHLANH